MATWGDKNGLLTNSQCIKAKIEVPKTKKKEWLYVKVKMGIHIVKALVDIEASNNFPQVKEGKCLGIMYTMEWGLLKQWTQDWGPPFVLLVA